MAERIPETLQKKLSGRLGFYEDLGIRLFYRDRGAGVAPDRERRLELPATAHFSTPDLPKEQTLPKPAGKPALQKAAPAVAPVNPKIPPLPPAAGPSLFDSVEQTPRHPLLQFPQDLTHCSRSHLPSQ